MRLGADGGSARAAGTTEPAEPDPAAEAAEAAPTLLEQMGGWSGAVASTLPVLVLVPVNGLWGLGPALVAALAAAALILLWRLARRENLQPAVSGVMGVAICAAIAWWIGDAKGYFLYGIWMSLAYAGIAVLSILLRRPLVGLLWGLLHGRSGSAWHTVPAARRAHALATLAWAVVFLARFVVQRHLYQDDATGALAVARILMGWPMTAVAVLVTVLCVRRADRAGEAADPERSPGGTAR